MVQQLAAELPRLLPNLTVEKISREAKIAGGRRADLIVQARAGNLRRNLLFEVKSIGEPRMVEMAITQLRRMGRASANPYLVFAAPYISERAREICRSEGIGYVDLAGNAWLSFGSVLVDRIGKQSQRLERRGLRSLLAPKATRVLRVLLESPSEPMTITEIAQRCSMSLAGAYLVVDRLQSKGFVARDTRKRVTVPTPRILLLEWARAWSIDRNGLNRYFSFDKSPDQLISRISEKAKDLGLEYAFTGMAGASIVAPFVRFEDVWAYVKGDQSALVKALDLRPVSSGANVVLLAPYDAGVFTGAREVDGKRIVSDIQLVVDLYSNPARGQEQAEFIMSNTLQLGEAR